MGKGENARNVFYSSLYKFQFFQSPSCCRLQMFSIGAGLKFCCFGKELTLYYNIPTSKYSEKGSFWKHFGKRRKCWIPAFSPFPKMLSIISSGEPCLGSPLPMLHYRLIKKEEGHDGPVSLHWLILGYLFNPLPDNKF